MKTIRAHHIPRDSLFLIKTHKGAQVLSVGVTEMHREPCVWLLVDLDAPPIARAFARKETGDTWDDEEGVETTFVGTYQDRFYIFHVFDLGERGLEWLK
jgi:hypothetical protein